MKTRAALFHAPGRPLEVREIELEEPGPGDVIVRMTAIGVCGSDLHVIKGEWPRPTPIVLGHEGAGVVEQLGSEVEGLAVGDPVVLSWAPSCGECATCRSGRLTACTNLRNAIGAGTLLDGTTRMTADGETVFRMTTTAALSEHVLIPASQALPIPADVAIEEAALLGCAALTAIGGVENAAQVQPGQTVMVVGAGGVGQMAVQGARIAGASEIIVVDPNQGRLEAALALGATTAVTPDELKGTMKQLAPDGVDHALEAVGAAETIALAFRWIRIGGKATLLGIPPAGTKIELDPFDFTTREKTLTGTIAGSETPTSGVPRLVEYIRQGKLKVGQMLGPSYSLDEVNEAVAASLAGAAGRVLVKP